jgi:hypothetical protein
MYRNIKLVPLAEPVPEEALQKEEEASAEKRFQDLLG